MLKHYTEVVFPRITDYMPQFLRSMAATYYRFKDYLALQHTSM